MRPLSKLIPIGFFASFGAPILYTGYAIASRISSIGNLDIGLIGTIFGVSWIFSLVATLGSVLIGIGIIRLLRIKSVNVPLVSFAYMLGSSVVIASSFGLKTGFVFAVLALTNTAIFVVLSCNSGTQYLILLD